ncbi:Uu.00g032760.m01.CDS01 [Anthostomella pinea]|uniref:Uu.00g032760.m01.CDS01 n=1 Tax=Anthostomella pinea TaxID=933095 RepID=A0AAI8V3V4_9PEZI|nr:Uu.00g032760.m01.CDS01 [Anthostomella pinea]
MLRTAELANIAFCQALSQTHLGDKVYYPHTAVYDERLESYWSVSAALQPWCMVLPSTAEDVSLTIKALTEHQCPFGIRSGGHGTSALSNSVQDGVTIDFGHMNATTYDPETKIASIQPGGYWGPVYETLAPYGVTVTGARDSTVGVGGFITGGGNSFHSATNGFACDNVKNFEVVLADGRIVNANSDENADLWLALKGCSGNLGLVTRFDMYTIDYADPTVPEIFGGIVSYDVSATDAVIHAYVAFADNVASDEDSSSIIWWAYNRELGGMSIAGCLDNAANEPNAPAFDGFLSIPGIKSNTMRSASMFNITSDFAMGEGVRNIWMTSTYKNDPCILHFAAATHEEMVHRIEAVVSPDSGLGTVLQFQPITHSMVRHAAENGGNMMGLEDRIAGGTGAMLLIYVAVKSAEEEALALPLVQELQDAIDEYAASVDANWNWRYLNYAHGNQDPVAMFGAEPVAKLRAASAKYDPEGVFQKLRQSGFKIPPGREDEL